MSRKATAILFFGMLLFAMSGIVYAADLKPTVYTYDLKHNASSKWGQITACGLLTDQGSTSVIEYGFVWSQSSKNPEMGNRHPVGGSGDSLSPDFYWEFLPSNYPGLSSPDGFTVYITAYAVNAAGTAYGDTMTISGVSSPGVFISLGSVTADDETAYYAVTFSGTLDSGGRSILEKGFVFSGDYSSPTVKNGTIVRYPDSADGVYSMTVSDLGSERSYSVSAYAKYGNGANDYVYSESRHFNTASYPREKIEPYMTGTAPYYFSPDNNGTYIEVATMLYNLLADPKRTYDSPYRYLDVDYTNPHTVNVVNFVSGAGYMVGSDSNLFMTYEPISRASVAVIVSQVMKLGNEYNGPMPIPSAFRDTDSHWSGGYVYLAVQRGIFSGYQEDGEILFKPENYVTKAELAAIFCQMFDRSGEPMGDKDFLDVPPGHWAYQYIMNAAVAGY